MKSKDVAYKVRSKEVWVNSKTGEQKEVLRIDKILYKDSNFNKVLLIDYITSITKMGRGKTKVLNYILDKLDNSSSLFISTVRHIVQKTESGTKTVIETLDVLCHLGFIKKIHSGVYQVNKKNLLKSMKVEQQGLLINSELKYSSK